MKETRTYPASLISRHEDRAAGNQAEIEGHAAVFNQLSPDLGGFQERIAPGAFQNALRDAQDVVANVNHNDNQLLGRTRSRTLDLEEDEDGLLARIKVPNTTLGRDMIELVGRGDLDKMSFRFSIRDGGESWAFPEAGLPIRTITDVDLYDVSIVAFPAYDGTDVSVAKRSMEQAKSGHVCASQAHYCPDVLRKKARLKGLLD